MSNGLARAEIQTDPITPDTPLLFWIDCGPSITPWPHHLPLSPGAFGQYQWNIKWFDIGYSNFVKQAKPEISTGPITPEYHMNIKWFNFGYSNLIIFAKQAKS